MRSFDSAISDGAKQQGALKFMTTQEAAGSRTYMMVAGVLMVCLLTFGVLHSLGVLR